MTITKDQLQVGQRITDTLQESLGKQAYERWFGAASMHIAEDRIQIFVPNRFTADWVSKRFGADLQHTAHTIVGPACEVQLNVIDQDSSLSARGKGDGTPSSSSSAPTNPTTTPTANPSGVGSSEGLSLKPAKARRPRHGTGSLHHIRYDLKDYVVGRSNELAYISACNMIDMDEPPFASLFIHGQCGVGKTHLLQGLCKRFSERHPGASWRYVTAEQFTNEYIDAVRHKTLSTFRRNLRRMDLLVVDDIHFMTSKNATQNEFLHTFNEVVDIKGARVIMASDCQPHVLESFNPALVSRFLSGMVAVIEEPDHETRRKIIKQLAVKRKLTILDSVVDALVERCSGSVRDLEGWMTQLSAMNMLYCEAHAQSNQPIGHTLLNQLFKDTSRRASRKPVTFDDIMNLVCKELILEPKDLLTRSRHRQLVLGRCLVIVLCRKLTHMSYPDIARHLKRSNHSTIITAYQSFNKRLEGDQSVQVGESQREITLKALVERLVCHLHQRPR